MTLYNSVNETHRKLIVQFGESMYKFLNIAHYSDQEILDLLSREEDIQKKLDDQFLLGKQSSKGEIDHYKYLYEVSFLVSFYFLVLVTLIVNNHLFYLQ